MALVFDDRANVGAAPGVHAFIVGVSDYLNLPEHDDPPEDGKWSLNKLTSGALSAFKTFEFVQNFPLKHPLKTVRLLLSPSPIELAAEPALAGAGASRASRENFEKDALAWRDDAAANPLDMTLFYFSGHGIQRGPEEGILLLDDFLAPGGPLNKCAEIGDIRDGMAPSPTFPNIGLTQFYFVDACRSRPETLKKFVNPNVPDVFGAELNVVDRREAPVVFSTVDGAFAVGREGKPSHFAEALITALQRAAEDPIQQGANTVWPVTSITLKNALDAYYAKNNLGTKITMGGVVGLPIIRMLPGPPDVDLSVLVQPTALGNPSDVWLRDENDIGVPDCNPTQRTAFDVTIPAGIYRVEVDAGRLVNRPYRSQMKFITQRMSSPWLHNLATLLGP